MSRCNDNNMGDMLHAYELNLLSQEEKDAFEVHVLNCDYCFGQIKEFSPRGRLLISSPELKNILAEDGISQKSFIHNISKYLWPDELPIFLRPAILLPLLIIIVILLSDSYMNIQHEMIRSARVIYLTPERATSTADIKLRLNEELILTFVYLGCEPDKNYQLSLTSSTGDTVYFDDKFKDFDDYDAGRLIIPAVKLSGGAYQLTITNQESNSPESRQVYNFKITK